MEYGIQRQKELPVSMWISRFILFHSVSGEPRASKADVSYAVSCLLNIIVTPLADVSSCARRLSNAIAMNEVVSLSPPSFVQRVLPRKTDSSSLSPSVCSAAYLGKILCILFACLNTYQNKRATNIAKGTN